MDDLKKYLFYFNNHSATEEECEIVYHYMMLSREYDKSIHHACGPFGQKISDDAYYPLESFWQKNKSILLRTDFKNPPRRHICQLPPY